MRANAWASGRPRGFVLVTAVLLASLSLPERFCLAKDVDWNDASEVELREAMRLYLAGQCGAAAQRLTELGARHPELAGLAQRARECAEDPSTPALPPVVPPAGAPPAVAASMPSRQSGSAGTDSTEPAYQRGLLFLPAMGVQVPLHAVSWFASGLRFGALIGGHLSDRYSLGGEPGVSTWTFSFCDGSPY